MNAFLYLVGTSARNRFISGLQRVRSPRYAIALVAGAVYIWAFLLRPTAHPSAAFVLLGQPTEMIVTLLMVLTLMGSWVFGSDLTALAFSQAEVALLFPAPLSRRALIGYKLFRAQVAVLINSLIWVFVLRRGGTLLPSPLRAMALWILFSTLNLHRLGAALVRSSWAEHGRVAAKRHAWSILVFGALGIALLAGLARHAGSLRRVGDIGEFFGALGAALASPPASYALFPFHLIVAPTFAHSVSEWTRAVPLALLMLLLHALWVLRTDSAFEEAAVEASAERARRLATRRSRRWLGAAAPLRSPTSGLPLAPAGHPALAIVWKNMLCLRRTAQLRLFIGPVVMSLFLGMALGSDGDVPEMVAASALAMAIMLFVFGGRLIRNDLRHDMQHLPLLKTLPVAPGDIVLAEVVSAALPMAILQMALVVTAFVAIGASRFDPLGADFRVGLLLAAPFAISALNAALLTIQNGTAVLFPAWVRLGPVVSTGVEALGQNVVATIANLAALGFGLIVPLMVVWAVIGMLHQTRAATIAAVIMLASIILAAETYATMRYLGTALSRAEPLQAA